MANTQRVNGISDLQAQLSQEWYNVLKDEFTKSYWNDIVAKLNSTKKWLPAKQNIFAALNRCPPNKVKVVILGQDPYIHNYEACGYSFSVPVGTITPPSLRNIFKELSIEYNMQTIPANGCLEPWAEDGVLLLNSVLTVEEGKSDSHKGIGWENFTSAVIRYVDLHRRCVFLSWGRKAQLITDQQVKNNQVLVAGHPSPLNTIKPFVGCNCFKECNEILKENDVLPVRWLSIY